MEASSDNLFPCCHMSNTDEVDKFCEAMENDPKFSMWKKDGVNTDTHVVFCQCKTERLPKSFCWSKKTFECFGELHLIPSGNGNQAHMWNSAMHPHGRKPFREVVQILKNCDFPPKVTIHHQTAIIPMKIF